MQRKLKSLASAALLLAAIILLYHGVIVDLVRQWATDENYSHGFLILPIALYFVWERRAHLAATTPRPTVWGLLVVLASLAMLVAGTLGAELFLTRFSLLATLTGAVWFIYGWPYLRILAFPLAFLLLMIPLPAIILNQIVFPLQLLAARFGGEMLLALNVPVLREGNLIVLASTVLEVVEACSGIRSLFSLVALGAVLGYFTDPRLWMRAVIISATVPVAILTNGLRLVGTGVAVQLYGPELAEEFFHTFSGLLIFVTAFLMLFGLTRLMLLIAPLRSDAIRSARISEEGLPPKPAQHSLAARTLIIALCLGAGALVRAETTESEIVPIREPLSGLPMRLGKWEGRATLQYSDSIVAALGASEYLSRFYFNSNRTGVHLYVGYYESQRQGETIHSPKNCLPGAGWLPLESGRIRISVGSGNQIEVNRYVIKKGDEKQLVLYWYQSHGRVIASEYWAKIYLVADAFRLNRTDGGLVRVITPIIDTEKAAEQHAVAFVKSLFPLLDRHLPT